MHSEVLAWGKHTWGLQAMGFAERGVRLSRTVCHGKANLLSFKPSPRLTWKLPGPLLKTWLHVPFWVGSLGLFLLLLTTQP